MSGGASRRARRGAVTLRGVLAGAAGIGMAASLGSCRSLEPELPVLPGQDRPVGAADILGSTANTNRGGSFLGGGFGSRVTSLPELPTNPGDGRIQGMGRPSGTSGSAPWVPAEMLVVPEEDGVRIAFDPAMPFDLVLRRDETARLRSRLQRVELWLELAPANDSLERWILEKRWMVPGPGGSVAARRRMEIWFHSVQRGAWVGLRLELREEDRPEFGWEGDFLLAPAEIVDWLGALP